MSEIPMYPNECEHRREPGRCWECLGAALLDAKKHGAGMAQLATHLQSELDRERGRADAAEHKLGQIRVVLDNYSNDEHFSARNAIGAIEELKP